MRFVILRSASKTMRAIALAVGTATLLSLAPAQKLQNDHMSGMGRLAHRFAKKIAQSATKGVPVTGNGMDWLKTSLSGDGFGNIDPVGDEASDDGYMEGPAGGQAETSIAVDSTGMHVVIGFNDTRGFSLNPTSVSGFAYSDDGGVTFTDGGQLPVTTGTSSIGATILPQVFGDPDIKYIGGSTFVYSSIMIKKFSATQTAQTMCVHVSTDFGHTWQGPYEVTAATNPHGALSGTGAPRDAADKEFTDYDPVSGRFIMSWSNFTPFAPGGVEIKTTYCDNITSGSPTFSAGVILAATSADGQASIPRFGGGGVVYCAWRRFPGGLNQNVGFSKSTDNGVTWSAATNTTSDFFTMDQVIGNDRINTSPSIAIDKSNGNLYLVYTNNASHDGGDVMYQKSTDGGATWSSAVALDARPGSDGPQWFPWVTVDKNTGRVSVFYYDQGEQNGDMSDATALFSDDGGLTWSAPFPLNPRPFHLGYGNDTGQPNVGDYNQAVAQAGMMYSVFAANPVRALFTDGQPSSASMTIPDTTVTVTTGGRAALRLENVSFVDSHHDGVIDPNETMTFMFPLQAYATGFSYTNVNGTLTTTTPNVSITTGSSGYGTVNPGAPQNNLTNFVVKTSPAFVPGTFIQFKLSVSSDQGTTDLLWDQKTGFGNGAVIYSENFDAIAPGTLPAGWATSHAGGNNTVPWTTSSTRMSAGGNNALFHQNANDGLSGNHVRFERAFSPLINMPSGDYATVDFDVSYNLEDDPNFNIQAFDGMLLRITDQTVGSTLRSIQLEACADEFTTDGAPNYPKHLPRSSNANYFQDMNCWSGYSHGYKHVHAKFYGMASRRIQLRFEYTQDSNGTGLNTHPEAGDAGVLVDNIVVRSFTNGVTPNTAPHAANDSFGTNENTPVSGNVLTNDTDAEGDSLNAVKDSDPAHGTVTLNADGSFTYTPNTGTYGADSFTYHANDGMLDSSVATVNVYVDGIPTAIVGPDQTFECTGSPIPFTVSGASSSDPENEALTYEWKEGPVVVGTNATFSGTVTHGTRTFTLTVTDTHGQTSPAATIHVVVVDTTPPVINVTGPNPMKVSFGSTFVDPGATANDLCDGSVSVTPTGTVDTNAIGTYTITYHAVDAAGNPATATRTVKVIYDWSGVLQPINSDGSSIFKLGSVVPVKFQLTGGSAGQVITAHLYFAQVSGNIVGTDMEAVSPGSADSGNTFRYAAPQYVFNWSTKGLSPGTYQLRIDLGDGETHTVLVSLKP